MTGRGHNSSRAAEGSLVVASMGAVSYVENHKGNTESVMPDLKSGAGCEVRYPNHRTWPAEDGDLVFVRTAVHIAVSFELQQN